ncbi:MAG: ABC transporter permease [Acidobacteria bacterium]|nr:ABC transporter permease [Acidobacteriota bacterium]
MNPLDAFKSAYGSLSSHRLRSILSMLGMLFGVGAVIAMLAIGAGAERQAMAMIERLGLRNVLLKAKEFKKEELDEMRKKSPGVSLRDGEAIAQALPQVELVAPVVKIEPYKVLAAGGSAECQVYGVSFRQKELFGMKLAEGRYIDAKDEKESAQVCVIGQEARKALFGFGPVLGQDLKVNDVWLEVVGVFSAQQEGSFTQGVQVGSLAREIDIPETTALRKFDRDPLKSPVDEVVLRLAKDASPQKAALAMRGLVERLHGGVDDYEIIVPEALLEQSRRTQRLFSIVMGCIAGISLLVGGIGIMNIMLASVLERTREIGIRLAVGAKGRDIALQFVSEAAAISLLGGLSGMVMGVAIAKIVAFYAEWPTVVTAFSVILAFGVSLAVGVLSGLYPAMRAAKLDPIEALRYE